MQHSPEYPGQNAGQKAVIFKRKQTMQAYEAFQDADSGGFFLFHFNYKYKQNYYLCKT